ncbi:hypothetical protein [Streptacidiphilus sp. EB103A]|uniref:hypothetical protein n=1 Tax=Streptacidiphilus sp. EB103A TaxID=3156275 RepID=UPI003513A4A9
MTERKKILLRLDPAVHDALARWAGDELRSTTAQIEYLLRQSLAQAGRLPGDVGALPRRGRPRKDTAQAADADQPRADPDDTSTSAPAPGA